MLLTIYCQLARIGINLVATKEAIWCWIIDCDIRAAASMLCVMAHTHQHLVQVGAALTLWLNRIDGIYPNRALK